MLHFGLGPVGRNIARMLAEDSRFVSVLGVDRDEKLLGKNFNEVLGLEKPSLEKVRIAQQIKKTRAKVAIHATSSWITEIEDQLVGLLKQGLHVVSTAEELVFPSKKNQRIVKRLHTLAKKKRVSLIGVGVNPGFVLDLLPATLSRVVHDIAHVHATRIVDLRTRRLPLQQKVGLALSPGEFQEKLQSKSFGHQGMEESLYLLAKGLGFKLTRVYSAIKPIVSDIICETRYFRITPGVTRGLDQEIVGFVDGKEKIRLSLKMIVGSEKESGDFINASLDEIVISGKPPVHVKIPNGIFGEDATAAAVINIIPKLVNTSPGFKTVLDL